jgi:hypothetical protein
MSIRAIQSLKKTQQKPMTFFYPEINPDPDRKPTFKQKTSPDPDRCQKVWALIDTSLSAHFLTPSPTCSIPASSSSLVTP